MESKQVLSIEQMQHLQELGLKLDYNTMLSWIVDDRGKDKPLLCISSEALDYVDFNHYCLPAYTLQDILELLPYKIVASYLNIGKKSFSGDVLFYIEYSNLGGYAISYFRSESLLDAAYEMLCWCIENGHLKMKGNENKSI